MPAILNVKEIEEISFVDKGASGDSVHRPAVVFWKRQTGEPNMGVKKEDKAGEMTVESILAELDEEKRNVLLAAFASGKQEDEEEKPEDEEKQEEEKPDEEEKQEAGEEEDEDKTEKRDIVVKALEEANTKIAKLEFDKALAEFTKVAETEMVYVPGMAAEDLGKVLKTCSDNLAEDVFAKLKTTLTACSRTIEKGELLVEIGVPGEEGSAMAKLEALAKDLHDKTPDQTYEQCYTKVLKNHPKMQMQATLEDQ